MLWEGGGGVKSEVICMFIRTCQRPPSHTIGGQGSHTKYIYIAISHHDKSGRFDEYVSREWSGSQIDATYRHGGRAASCSK